MESPSAIPVVYGAYIYIWCVCIYIYIYPGKGGFCVFKYCAALMVCTNNRVHYGLMVVYGYLHITLPHYHHYAILFEGIALLKCLSNIFCVECVSKNRSVLSIIFHAIYGAVCIQLTHFSHDDCENTLNWSYYHHQIRSMTHLPLFRVSSWNNGRRCKSFYILITAMISSAYKNHILVLNCTLSLTRHVKCISKVFHFSYLNVRRTLLSELL